MKHYEFKIFAGKYLPPMSFCTGNPYSKMFLTKIFYLLTDIQNFCCTFCDNLNDQLCKKYFIDTFKQL